MAGHRPYTAIKCRVVDYRYILWCGKRVAGDRVGAGVGAGDGWAGSGDGSGMVWTYGIFPFDRGFLTCMGRLRCGVVVLQQLDAALNALRARANVAQCTILVPMVLPLGPPFPTSVPPVVCAQVVLILFQRLSPEACGF